MRLAAGLCRPSAGSLTVLGEVPGRENANLLKRVGYLDQERLLYSSFRVDEMIRFGAATNDNWDERMASSYVTQLGIDLDARASSLSSGQKAQVALTLCLAKQPELLILDEPAAALDPLAREDLLRLLMQQVEQSGSSVVLSTHAISDIESVCEYIIILSRARVVLCDYLDFVLNSHRILTSATPENFDEPSGRLLLRLARAVEECRISCGWSHRSPETDGRSLNPPWRRLSWRIYATVPIGQTFLSPRLVPEAMVESNDLGCLAPTGRCSGFSPSRRPSLSGGP